MKFLKTLLWVVIAALAIGLAARNWRDVTIDLWGPLQADIKLPLLLGLMVLLGWLPTWLVMRGRLWQARRKAMLLERPVPVPVPPPPLATSEPAIDRIPDEPIP